MLEARRILYLGTLIYFFLASSLATALSFSQAYKEVNPAVVVVHTREQSVGEGPRGKSLLTTAQGLGSGVIISAEGLIMTAAHVVQVSDKIAVELADGTRYHASVLASAPFADVALIKLDNPPEKLGFAKLGDSDQVEIGEEVFVIGSPYGMGHTLTVGHISGRHSENVIEGDTQKIDFLQTDAAINKGNSGGPLFNKRGEVIGLVSHIKSVSGGSEGLGFAAAINMAQQLLLEQRTVWTGMEFIPLRGNLGLALNAPGGAGLLVQRTAKFSMGHTMGFQGGTIPVTLKGRKILLGGDIILSINGMPLRSNQDLLEVRNALVQLNFGEPIVAKIVRSGAVKELSGIKEKAH